MEITGTTIKLAIMFLPGFISASIIFALITRKKIDNRNYFVCVFLLSFASYFIQNIFVNIIELFRNKFYFIEYIKPNFISSIIDNSNQISYSEVFFTCVLSVLLGLLIAFVHQNKILYKNSKKAKIN